MPPFLGCIDTYAPFETEVVFWAEIKVVNYLFGILAEKAVSRKAEKNDPSNRSFMAAGVRAKTGNPSLSKR